MPHGNSFVVFLLVMILAVLSDFSEGRSPKGPADRAVISIMLKQWGRLTVLESHRERVDFAQPRFLPKRARRDPSKKNWLV